MSVAIGVLGLLIGSFLNVVIYRVPLGMSLNTPGSACPSCHHSVRPYDNIPVLSWLLLRGRCRDCAAPISPRYPAVELTTGVLFWLVALRIGLTPYLGATLVLAAGGVALTLIDLEHHRLPFAVTGAVAVGAALFLGADIWVDGTGPLLRAAMSVLLWVLVYGGAWFLTAGRGMGLGDVALAPVLGLVLGWLGWGPTLVGLLSGFVLGALIGVALLVTGTAERRSRIPHGPFMLAGAACGLFAGQPLWTAYLRLVGLS